MQFKNGNNDKFPKSLQYEEFTVTVGNTLYGNFYYTDHTTTHPPLFCAAVDSTSNRMAYAQIVSSYNVRVYCDREGSTVKVRAYF